jgi:hypothetical protein
MIHQSMEAGNGLYVRRCKSTFKRKNGLKIPINNALTRPAYHVNVTNGNLLPFVTYAAAAFGEG